MFTYSVIVTLLVLLLLKQNSDALKRIKEQRHNDYNIKQLLEAKDEMWDEAFELKRKIKLLEWRNQQLGEQLETQKDFNIKIVSAYNRIRESTIDVPYKHGRFFAVEIGEERILKSFSEN